MPQNGVRRAQYIDTFIASVLDVLTQFHVCGVIQTGAPVDSANSPTKSSDNDTHTNFKFGQPHKLIMLVK